MIDWNRVLSSPYDVNERNLIGSAYDVLDRKCKDLRKENSSLKNQLSQALKRVQQLSACSLPGIKNVIYNGATTIMLWDDGQKTICKLGEGETFDRYTGFIACVCKRLFGGTTTAKKLMNEKDPDYQAAKKAAEELKAKEKAAAEQAEREKAAAARRKKQREKAISQLMEEFSIEQEAIARYHATKEQK